MLQGFVEEVLTCNVSWGTWWYNLLSDKTNSYLDKVVGLISQNDIGRFAVSPTSSENQMVATCPPLWTHFTTYVHCVVGRMDDRWLSIPSACQLETQGIGRSLSSLREEITTISFPRHHIFFPALSLFGIIGTPATRLYCDLDPVSGHRGLLMCGSITGAGYHDRTTCRTSRA